MFFNTILALILLIALAPSSFAQASAPKKAQLDPNQPVLLVKGKDFLIHAIHPTSTESVLVTMTSSEDAMLVHTSLASGEMKVLVRGFTTVTWIPMGIDRFDYRHSSVVDYTADKERLYVLKADTHASGRADRRTGGFPSGAPSSYSLLVLQPESGKLLHTLDLGRPPQDAAKKVMRGAMSLRDNGVEVFGTRFEFKGTELLKPAPKSKK